MGSAPDPQPTPPADLDTNFSTPDHTRTPWPSPETSPNFRRVLYEYWDAIADFAKRLLHSIALSLDLEETYFDDLARFPMAGLRALHYPPQEVSTDVGIGAHADYCWFTLVNQLSGTPGLEVLNHNGHWVPATPLPNSLVVNVGDFLERATNDVFVSTVHRVRNTTGDERYSLAYFFTPTHDTMITTVPTCLKPGEKPKYEDVNAAAWSRERLYRARYKHPASLAAKANGEI